MPRNPTWHRDELILALDLYLQHGMLDDRDERVIELSHVLNRLNLHSSHGNPETFRNPNGVAMKMANLAALDTHYHGTALMRGGRRDAEVWDEFAHDRERLAREASAIRERAASLRTEPSPTRRYWTFLANPSVYRVEESIRQQTDTWMTKRSAVRAGDRALIWKSQGGAGGKRGIVAFAEILSDPEIFTTDHDPHWVDPASGSKLEPHVQIRYVHAPNLPLWYDDWAHPILDKLTVSRGQGTVFIVTPEQWEAVLEAAGGWPEEAPEVQDAVDAVAVQAGRKPSGQGFRMDSEQRRAIEKHAMEMAKAHYAGQGWTTIEDVSLRQSYDLHCSRLDGSELRVEVKGTTGTGDTVLLTPNEVKHAHEHYPNVALFIVAHIALTVKDGVPQAASGEAMVHEPWELDDERLKAIGFEYFVPQGGTK